jgi:hypothetical protein
MALLLDCLTQGLVNFIDTEEKSHLKNWELAAGVYQSCSTGDIVSLGVFLTSFVSCCPSNLLCVKVQYIHTVCGWEGVEVLKPVRDHILQEFSALYLTRFIPNKNL